MGGKGDVLHVDPSSAEITQGAVGLIPNDIEGKPTREAKDADGFAAESPAAFWQ